MPLSISYATSITVELDVEVEFDFYPGDPGRMYMPNGDPGYPPEHPELSITSIKLKHPDETTIVLDLMPALSDAYIEELETRLYEEGPQGEEPDEQY